MEETVDELSVFSSYGMFTVTVMMSVYDRIRIKRC
jgi:hypothetical protein